MKRVLLSMVLVVCACMVSMAQESFKITGKLGGTVAGNLVLVCMRSQGAVQLGQTYHRQGSPRESAGKEDRGVTGRGMNKAERL